MRLRACDMPEGLDEALKAAFTKKARNRGFLLSHLQEHAPASFALSVWHDLYDVAADRVVKGDPLREVAQHGGWRTVVHGDAGKILALAEMVQVTNGYALRSLAEGPFLDAFVRAIGRAESQVDGEETDYEISALEIGVIAVSALWLRGGTADADRIMPFHLGAVARMEPFALLTPQEFMEAAAKAARLVLADPTIYV